MRFPKIVDHKKTLRNYKWLKPWFGRLFNKIKQKFQSVQITVPKMRLVVWYQLRINIGFLGKWLLIMSKSKLGHAVHAKTTICYFACFQLRFYLLTCLVSWPFHLTITHFHFLLLWIPTWTIIFRLHVTRGRIKCLQIIGSIRSPNVCNKRRLV